MLVPRRGKLGSIVLALGALAAVIALAASCRRAPSAALGGTWEGEVANPRRPYVVTIDIIGGRGQIAAGRVVAGKVTAVAAERDRVAFELRIESETWRFEGVRRDHRIEGTVATRNERIAFWLEQLPRLEPPANRAQAWQQDLDVVAARFLRYDRSYDPERREAARARIERLRGAVAGMTDAQVMVELARAVALGGNAHTRLYLLRNRTELRRLPVRVWWFRDELRIVRAAAAHRDLVGCRVIDIDGLDIAAAADRVRGIKAGNRSWQRYMSSYFLTSPDVLSAVGVALAPDRATLALSCDGGPRKVALVAPALQRQTASVEAWWDLAPAYPHADRDFVSALPVENAPRYLRNAAKSYWFERVPGDDVIYVQVNRAQAMASDPIAEFTARIARELADRPPRALVVDVRFNTGGDLTVTAPLVDKLAAALRGAPVAVLTSRATFSAGITLTGQWKQRTGAVLIGEPVGDELDSWSEGGNLVLPNSGLTVHYANALHAYSKRAYPDREPVFDLDLDSLEPAQVVEPSWADYLAGADPVYDAALALLPPPRERH